MANMYFSVATLFLIAVTNHGEAASVTPVQKVLEMMSEMKVKGEKMMDEEQNTYFRYKEWVGKTSRELGFEIETSKSDIEKYTAAAVKADSDVAQLSDSIAKLESELASTTAEKKEATEIRKEQHAEYVTMSTDYSESVDALQRAIAVLKKQAYDRKQASSLAQVSALKDLNLIPKDAKKAIDIFLETGADEPEGLAVSAPEANAYEFQSSGIIEMLEKLLDKFIDERTTLEKEEMNSKHAYDMLMQDLKAQIAQATQDRDEKAVTKAKKLQAKADAEGDLKDTTTTMEADKKYLADLTATCEQKGSDFESRQQLRAEEIVAIEKAIEIISSEAVSGNADKHLPSMMQKKGSALSQLKTFLSTQAQDRVAQYLRAQAAKLNSRVLAAIAQHVADDPFAKVKKMIKDLIVRLMEEANEEAEHKGWCDTELSTNEQTRKEKTEAVETLHAEIDQLEASIAKLTEDISELTKAVAELDAAMAKATTLRTEEKAKNTETIADSQEAQTAVAQALTVLKEFYAKAGEATAFVQQPEIFDSPYKGMQAENGGVVGMLEVIESDFARLESDTKAAEATAQKEYDEFMTDSKVDKAQKSTDIEHKTAKKQDESQALVVKREDLEGTQKELDAALAYFDKLKPSCVDAGVSYEDRVARRKEEIESLQEALRILNGEDIA
mmetsp:Transcript_61157/g.97073  ORF Transcript_61157/g.97073 Transcript_61157/m.97073 type:complete len:670 (-) Transcript_61157:84-2093(-)